MATGFFWHERCFWHAGGDYALTVPLGGLVQPLAAGGLPESPEGKRRLKNLLDVTGLLAELDVRSAPEASREELLRVHPAGYLDAFKALSDAGGGEMGPRAPFARGGYEIAALSAGLAVAALRAVLSGELSNAYALCRPPGHHCTADWPNGFCLMNNVAVAVEAALAEGLAGRVAVVDWDVHHGNGTEAIFLERGEVLTVSLHQEHNYPLDTGGTEVRGEGAGRGANLNVPLPPGTGDAGYLAALERIVLPALTRFRPDAIVVACGFDAGAFDPLGRMLVSAEGFGAMTDRLMAAAEELCGGRLMMAHEGGYADVYVPFCGHRVIERLSGTSIRAPDPLAEAVSARQPNAAARAFAESLVDAMADELGSP